MADVSLEMILELLRKLQADIREIRETTRETLRRVGNTERAIALSISMTTDQEARIDRLSERVERIERRLELQET